MGNRNNLVAAAILAAICFFNAPIAVAAGGSPAEMVKKPVDPEYAAAEEAIQAKDWKTAIQRFAKLTGKEEYAADAYNWMGYAERNLGNYEEAFRLYEKALSLKPKHRGAHEYIGEAYLLTNNLPKAEEHLAALDKLCFFPCEEYTDLKKKVAEYKKNHTAAATN